MNANIKPSDRVAIVATLNPVSVGVGTSSTAYIDMKDKGALLALIKTGVLGTAATVDAKFEQATSSGGAGVKDVTGKALTTLTKAANDNDQAVINLFESDLDIANGFRYVRLTITVGAADSIVDATVLAFDSSYFPADHIESVVEAV